MSIVSVQVIITVTQQSNGLIHWFLFQLVERVFLIRQISVVEVFSPNEIIMFYLYECIILLCWVCVHHFVNIAVDEVKFKAARDSEAGYGRGIYWLPEKSL